MAERYIIFATSNLDKVDEVEPHFRRYGIKIIQYIKRENDDVTIIENIFTENPFMNIYAIIREQTSLFEKNTKNLTSIHHFQPVDHVSTLHVSMIRNKTVIEKLVYEYTTSGVIKLDLGSTTIGQKIFGWDDIFYLESCQKNYHELRKNLIKISSRDMVISKFLKEKIYYKNLIDLKHNPQKFTQSISFDTDGIILMYEDLFNKNPAIKIYGIDKIIKYNFEEGVYVSAPMNRRIKLNWNPGFNPIPLVRKEKDLLHEITYAVHDMGHFAFKPDLIFTGQNLNPLVEKLNKKLYLINRMMSEAITLPFADMFFVKSVLDSNNDYVTKAERKIYPLFERIMKINPITIDSNTENDEIILEKLLQYYKPILRANVYYCVLGNKSKFISLLKKETATLNGGSHSKVALSPTDVSIGETEPEFEQYDKKYSQFFIQDYRWTNQNYKQMTKDSHLHQKWWLIVANINDKFSLGFVSIDIFRNSLCRFKIDKLSDEDLVDVIFEFIFGNNIIPIFKAKYSATITNNLTKAFIRYLCNQIFIFIKYDYVPYANSYLDTILKLVDDIYQKNINTTNELINNVRSYIKTFLTKCVNSNAMTIDDASTFEELYSMVDPFIVNYDKEYEQPLNIVAKKILSGNDTDI
jgi:inosine/xanthosine triphosphate pyrophosphatase family protein